MDKYFDPMKLGTVIILFFQLIPICYLTWTTGLRVVNISTADPLTFFSENWDISSDDGKILIFIALNFIVWLMFLTMLICYFMPQILALYGVLKKKPLYIEPYIHVRVVEIMFWIILSILMAITFLNVELNEACVKVALIKFERNITEAGHLHDEESYSFRNLGRILFSLMVVFCMITYILYYLKSVVNSYYLRLKDGEEQINQKKTITNYLRLENTELDDC